MYFTYEVHIVGSMCITMYVRYITSSTLCRYVIEFTLSIKTQTRQRQGKT